MEGIRVLWLAREAIRQGNKAEGQKLLLQFLEAHPRSEAAWLWLSAIVDDPCKEQEYLERVLEINPRNAVAWNHYVKLEQLDVLRLAKQIVSLLSTLCPYCATPLGRAASHCELCGRNVKTGELLPTADVPFSQFSQAQASAEQSPIRRGTFGPIIDAIWSRIWRNISEMDGDPYPPSSPQAQPTR